MRVFKPHELVNVISDLQRRVAVLEAEAAKPAPVTVTVESSPAAPLVIPMAAEKASKKKAPKKAPKKAT